MKRPPSKIKRELIELRSALRRFEKKYREAVADAGKLDHMLQISARYDADRKVRDVQREIERTKRSIREAEVELMGDWAPKVWENPNG